MHSQCTRDNSWSESKFQDSSSDQESRRERLHRTGISSNQEGDCGSDGGRHRDNGGACANAEQQPSRHRQRHRWQGKHLQQRVQRPICRISAPARTLAVLKRFTVISNRTQPPQQQQLTHTAGICMGATKLKRASVICQPSIGRCAYSTLLGSLTAGKEMQF